MSTAIKAIKTGPKPKNQMELQIEGEELLRKHSLSIQI